MKVAIFLSCLSSLGIGIVYLSAMAPAQAISIHKSDFINNSDRTNFNGFEGLPANENFGELSNQIYTEDGITVEQVDGDQNGIKTNFTSWGAEGNRAWYANGGDFGYTKIVRQDNSDFVNIGLLIGSGYWNHLSVTYVYNVLNDGVSVLSGTLLRDAPSKYLGFSAGGFDEIRLGAYLGNNPNQILDGFQTLAIDSIELSAKAVPEPTTMLGTLAFSILGSSAWLKRKRKKA
ncbi:hypothetical protein [Merismopedia glauca]|uniref:PEP-CTERM sorting domain-containing protein n=1 Tax=Merismopedia glauca CCAP 1448/3 TaxID=1296344 RepID=A0A2T1CAA2_9CYAN|nr:hypothetical protein [Merismopedia glauca]PSB05205.1 hypothetical protein C7B64_00750 [Merismopedia glauca CCAP 1448/3]